MGQLRAGAERLAALGRQQEAAAAAREKASQNQQREWAAMRPRADALLREFVGELTQARVPAIALYQPQQRVRPQRTYPFGEQIYTSRYVRLGVGWLAELEYRSYEDGTKPGLFVAKKDLAVIECGPVQTGVHADGFGEKGEYVVANWGPNLDAPPADPNTPVVYSGPPLFATEAGQHILEAALVRYGVVK